MTRLHIDWLRCEGRGTCAELLPEVLYRDEWGYPLAREKEPEIPAGLERHARRAVRDCPRLALRLREP
jgi:ferredoxin